MKRRTAREKALQALFQIDMSEVGTNEAITHVLDGQKKDKFLIELINGVVEKRTQIDELISTHLKKWSLNRLANVDRNILRIAVFELKYRDDIPNNVVLNEAIEIAKLYSDDESSKFVNGVLSKIKASIEEN